MFPLKYSAVNTTSSKHHISKTLDLPFGEGVSTLYLLTCDSLTVSSTWEFTSVYMRYSQGDGVNTSLSRPTFCVCLLVYSCCVFYCVQLCYVVCSRVISPARSCATWDDNNKDNVCTPTIPAGLKRPPPSKTTSLITWFGTVLNTLSVLM